MDIEDISEEQAHDILLFYARKHGWTDVTYDKSYFMRFTDNDDYTYVWSEFPSATVKDADAKYICLSTSTDKNSIWKSFLQQILEICNNGMKITMFTADAHDTVVFPAGMSLESMLIECDLNGVVQKHVH